MVVAGKTKTVVSEIVVAKVHDTSMAYQMPTRQVILHRNLPIELTN